MHFVLIVESARMGTLILLALLWMIVLESLETLLKLQLLRLFLVFALVVTHIAIQFGFELFVGLFVFLRVQRGNPAYLIQEAQGRHIVVVILLLVDRDLLPRLHLLLLLQIVVRVLS